MSVETNSSQKNDTPTTSEVPTYIAEMMQPTPERIEDGVSLAEALTSLPESLRPRIDTAIESSEFQRTPEVEQAIAGYYQDHYKTALIVERMLEGDPIDLNVLTDDASAMGSFTLTESIESAATAADRSKQLQKIDHLLGSELFAEVAIGQTTLGEQEVMIVETLRAQLRDTAEKENIYLGYHSRESFIETLERRKDQFWQDSRPAGQLEFHNTPFADELAQSNFKLRTRSNQQKYGQTRMVTAGIKGHSSSIHFSEQYMTDGYKRVQLGEQVDHVTVGGTVAMPLAEIVKQLPYARGGEYGVLALKSDAIDKSTVIDSVSLHTENPGSPDDKPSKYGDDRTFYADRYNTIKAEDYEIDFGRGMSTSTGNTSKVIFLQRDIDAAHRKQYMLNAGNIDARMQFGAGEGIPLVEVLAYDYGKQSTLEHGHFMNEGKQFVDSQYHGHSANALGLVDPRLSRTATEHSSYREAVTPEQQAAELRQSIADMQQKSREHAQYKGKVVAMLRGGTMAFRPRP